MATADGERCDGDESDALRFYCKDPAPNPVLLIVFGGLDQRFGGTSKGLPPFEFCNVLRHKVCPSNCNILFVRDRLKAWYFQGVHGESSCVDSTVNFFFREAKQLGTSRIITMGSSMGGFGALMYGHLLAAAQVIAFGPQLFLDKAHRTTMGDTRWSHRLDEVQKWVKKNQGKRHRHLLNIRNWLPFRCPVVIHCGMRSDLDVLQARSLCTFAARRMVNRKDGFRNSMGIAGIFAHVEGGHNVVTDMRNNGKLVLLLKQALSSEDSGISAAEDISYGGKDMLWSALQAEKFQMVEILSAAKPTKQVSASTVEAADADCQCETVALGSDYQANAKKQQELISSAVAYKQIRGRSRPKQLPCCLRCQVRSAIRAERSATYRTLPLERAKLFKFGTMVDLDYPGLQLVHQSDDHIKAPVFVVHGFLSETECDQFDAKLNSQSRASMKDSTTQFKQGKRKSKEIRLVREETTGFHAKVAALTSHVPKNCETVKLIDYEKGDEFQVHSDSTAWFPDEWLQESFHPSGAPLPLPRYTNRELTLLVYLNDVPKGGETVFYNCGSTRLLRERGRKAEVLRVRPEKGMAVLFYPTIQPMDGADLPPIMDPENEGIQENKRKEEKEAHGTVPRSFATPDMWHASLTVESPKRLAACWVWPLNCDRSRMRFKNDKQARRTDGVAV